MRWKLPPNLRACLPRFHEKLSVAWKVVSQVSYGPFWGSPGLEKLLIEERNTPKLRGVQHVGNAELFHPVEVWIAGVEVAVYRLEPAHTQLEFIQFGGADYPGIPQHTLMSDGAVHSTHTGEHCATPRRVARLVAVAVAELKIQLCVGLPVDSGEFRVGVGGGELRLF